MAKAATSGQARAFNAMIISRLDEEVLKQIDGGKFHSEFHRIHQQRMQDAGHRQSRSEHRCYTLASV